MAGIRVNGDWQIDVIDADGELYERYVFSNSLTGKPWLGYVMSGNATMRWWTIELADSGTGLAPCMQTFSAQAASCFITRFDSQALNYSQDLTNSSDDGVFTLTGRMTAKANGSIDRVATLTNLTGIPSVSGVTIQQGDHQFTSTTLSEPLEIRNGQQVVVTVNISFS